MTIFIRNDSADRNHDENVFSIFSIAKLRFPVFAIRCKKMLAEIEIGKRFNILRRLNINRAATPSIATIGSATRNGFFMPKGDCAIAAFARLNRDFEMIKHGLPQ